jgi:alpha-1,2-mannosyltransferase
VYPAGINAAHTVLLEPWVVLFCLLGLLAIFDGDQLAARPRRLAWGGAAFGVAAAIKLWALLPGVVLLVVAGRRIRGRAARAYLGGFAVAFGVLVAPFVVLAPHAFYSDVVVAQVSRVDLTRLSEWDRLASLTGLSAFASIGHGVVLAVAVAIGGFVLVCAAGASLRDRRVPPALERFALVTAALVLLALLWPPDYYLHYAWFFAPFLALSMALAAARVTSPRRGPIVPLLLGLAVVIAAVLTVVQVRQEAQLIGYQPKASADRQIPAGACVLTDIASLTITADRFVPSRSDCSPIVDAIGTDYALSRGHNGVSGAGRTPALQALWLSAFGHAQYVWLACAPTTGPQCKTNRRIPWTPAIRAYFSHHFSPDRRAGAPADLYVRRAASRRREISLLTSAPV